jgi:hypothetical protein
MIDAPVDSVCPGVVSSHPLCFVILLAELRGAVIDNAYLKAKLFDIWMRENGEHYKYIAVTTKDPKAFMDQFCFVYHLVLAHHYVEKTTQPYTTTLLPGDKLNAKNVPPPLPGNKAVLTPCVDAIFYYALITGHGSTGCAPTGVPHLLALTDIPPLLNGYSILFGINKSVTAAHRDGLSYHRVREAIAVKILNFFYISGSANPADVLSKHTGHADAWPLIQPLLFWRGQPAVIPLKKQQDADVQVIGECQDLKRTEANTTVRANKAHRSLLAFVI